MNQVPCIALLLAGGQGCRMHSRRPKQFITVKGVPVLAYPLRTFQNHDGIDKIYVVCTDEWSDFVRHTVAEEDISKFVRTIPSGTASIDSIRNGIESIRQDYGNQNPIVMLHEAVRPLISAEIISLNLKTFRTHGNAVTAIGSNEAYMVSSDGVSSSASIPRERLFRAQTPQTFFLKDIEEAFERAKQAGKKTSQSLYTLMTETCGEKPLYIAQGNAYNFKLTLPEDIELLEAVLSYRKNR